jgi:hypothetical protein
MRLATLLLLAVPILFAPSSALAYEMPYDPYPWCAVYSGDGGGGTNCGFLTIQQCRDTVPLAVSAHPINSTIQSRLRALVKGKCISLH